ncbi:HNHc domain containing protein [uncultured Caudovirales phage]|uniref:HNHc domain containing protein n=1 Tax=uncultured Caudovirales phage TaxID=2100421 RepID=A0A6J5KSJ3_9CAUD|nr:HNHc domain containing protein [uncultured Caudovirales phage]
MKTCKAGIHKYEGIQCMICKLAKTKAWEKANLDKVKIKEKAWKEANKSKVTASVKKWDKANPEKKRARNALHRARKLSAIPKDQTLEEAKAIADLYLKCQEMSTLTNILHEVDHRIPLSKGGKHTLDNLQILIAKENGFKKNKYDGTPENDSWRQLINTKEKFDGFI